MRVLYAVIALLCVYSSAQNHSKVAPRVKHENEAQRGNEPRENPPELPKPPSTTISAGVAQPNIQDDPNRKPENRTNLQIIRDYLKAAFSPNNLSNWILALLGTIGAGFAYKTLNALLRQTKASEVASEAAKKGADAAWLNAEAVIRAERAYMVIKRQSPYTGAFQFFAVNEGRTPAEIVSVYSAFISPASESEISIQYGEDSLIDPRIVTSGEKQFIRDWGWGKDIPYPTNTLFVYYG